jgi:low affinity Fe/Cu permease
VTFDRLAQRVSWAAGKPVTFALAALTVLVWAVTGPFFGFSDTWQLVINTGTTIVTFLMCFAIQATQNRDAAAIQAKLDELIRAGAARNEFIGLDQKPADVIEAFRDELRKDPLRGWWHW